MPHDVESEPPIDTRPQYQKPEIIELTEEIALGACSPHGSAPGGSKCTSGINAGGAQCRVGTGAGSCRPGSSG